MAMLRDIIAFVINSYPENLRSELSNARITKMIYLSDWKNCLENDRQISDIEWYFDNHGPYVHDIIDTVLKNDRIFSVKQTENYYGGIKRLISVIDRNYAVSISKREANSVRSVIDVTKKLYWANFIKLVYSTFPVSSSIRYSRLDLVSKAREYKRISGQ